MIAHSMPNEDTIYWEDFHLGEKVEIGSTLVTREEIIEFASRYDPQPFHVDEAKGRDSMFGGLIASGWHTCALVMRMMCDAYLLESSSLGSPGLENIRWIKPVRPGDVLRTRMVVLEARPMASKPEVGLLRNRWELINQNNEEVMQMEGYGMFGRRRVAVST